MQGPFVMASTTGPAGAYIPIYRCIRSDGLHFFSPSSTCEGQRVEHIVGYASPARSSNTPRGLRRCRHQTPAPTHYYHMLDGPCDAGDADEGLFGYVH